MFVTFLHDFEIVRFYFNQFTEDQNKPKQKYIYLVEEQKPHQRY